ncbi:MAG: ATP-binding protein [bacterium]|nr:ATP-binding protein [bacterium]
MRKQFLRIYIGIAGVLLLSTVGFLLISRQWFGVLRETEFANRRLELISAIRQELDGAGDDLNDRLLVINMFSLTHQMSLWLNSMLELPLSSEEKARLRAGEIVTVEMERGLLQTYAVVDEDEILVLGPYRLGEMMQWQDDIIDLNGRPMWRDGPGKFQGRRGGFRRGPSSGLAPNGMGFPPPTVRMLLGPELVLLGILSVCFCLIGAAIYVLIRPLERRIRALSEVTEQFGHGDLGSRAIVRKNDAVAELADRFNWMADRIEDLVEGQQELLRAVSHELRTPLARLFFLMERLQKIETSEDKDALVLRINRSLKELNNLVDELLAFVRVGGNLDAAELEEVDVLTELWEMPDAVMELREDVVVKIQCDPLKVLAIPRYFKRALINLVTNAVRHAQGQIWIEGSNVRDGVQIAVEDDGSGISADLREKVLEPFFRVDESRNAKIGGTGLGLAIVHRIMQLHGGRVEVEKGRVGGARFVLSFPDQKTDVQSQDRDANSEEIRV